MSGRFGVARTAAPTTVVNMMPTKTAMSFSTSPYRPNHTRANPIRPIAIAQTLRSGPSGNSATSGSADDDIAVAP